MEGKDPSCGLMSHIDVYAELVIDQTIGVGSVAYLRNRRLRDSGTIILTDT